MPRAQTLILACRNGLSNGPLPHALATNNEILPALKSLTLIEHVDRYNEPPVDTSVLAEMLRARWGQGLKEFRLSTTQAMFTSEQMAQFVDLAKAGMKVKIQSHGSGPFLKVWFDSDIAKQW
uniref:Uncharacterized protein n=1 Tax=Mycena chlorophos TaxID=658473 RepID=A0ABQ0L136_MYCCL|nr:predicted protein [Mycena chlorophos]